MTGKIVPNNCLNVIAVSVCTCSVRPSVPCLALAGFVRPGCVSVSSFSEKHHGCVGGPKDLHCPRIAATAK